MSFLLCAAVLLSDAAQVRAAPPSQQRQLELVTMIRHDCGACHGISLHGGLGPPLTTESLADKPHGLLFNTIMLGRPNTAMPPWQGLLSDEEIDWLVRRLLSGNIDTVPVSDEN